MQNKKFKSEELLQRREKEYKAIQARLSSRRAESAYNQWLEKKQFRNSLEPPRECEKRKESIASPYLHSAVCATCSYSSKECSTVSHRSERRVSTSIKVSHHQEQKNLDSIGKPDKLHPYTNFPLGAKKLHKAADKGRSGSIASSSPQSPMATVQGSGRSSRASSYGVKFYAKRLKLNEKIGGSHKKSKDATKGVELHKKGLGNIETVVSSIADSEGMSKPQRNGAATSSDMVSHQEEQSDYSDTESDELDFSKLNREEELVYPQYEFDVEDESSLFHDVGEFNNLESLSLPSVMTKDRTPAEILQLLSRLGGPGRNYRRSNSYSYSSRQSSGTYGRRLSLGCIPEGKIVTDYKEEEDNDLDSQFLRDMELTIQGTRSSDEDDGKEEGQGGRSPSPSGPIACASSDDGSVTSSSAGTYTDYSLSPSPAGFTSGEAGAEEEEPSAVASVAPPKTLKVINFAWDSTSNLVRTHVSSTTPITPLVRRLPLKALPTQPNSSPHDPHPPTTEGTPYNLPTLEVTPPATLPAQHRPAEAASSTVRKTTPPLGSLPSRKITPPPYDVMPPAYCETISSASGDISGNLVTQPREATPPPGDVAAPTRKMTPPMRKVTPPPRKFTPPSRKITPPSRSPLRKATPPPHDVLPLVLTTCMEEDASTMEPEAGGYNTPFQNTLSFHSSPSNFTVSSSEQTGEAPKPNPAAPSRPVFYLEESEEEEVCCNFC